jgi:alpha-tubulin suppressor-like RCC1 family protein
MSFTLAAGLRANKPQRNVGVISAGYYHGAAIQRNGRVWTWGVSGAGLGIGTNTTNIPEILAPVRIIGSTATFCKIASGGANIIALDKNGRAWTWGSNLYGQLGDNTNIDKCSPVSVIGTAKTFCEISAGSGYFLAIDKNGRAWAWGVNISGQLGDNTIVCKLTPISVLGAVKTFCKISAGPNGDYSTAIDKNGLIWGWGNNYFGQLGNNAGFNSVCTPVSVAGALKTFCQIAAGAYHTAAIDKNGKAWGWGAGGYGQNGNNTNAIVYTPVSVVGASKTFCKISVGFSHTLALDKNGRAWAWGRNVTGELGDGSLISRFTPVSVAGVIKTFCEISAGIISNFIGRSLAIDKNGRAWGWGYNYRGILGINSVQRFTTPASICGAKKTFCQIALGAFPINPDGGGWGLAIDKNGLVWGWGLNQSGQLGQNIPPDFCRSARDGVVTPISIVGALKTFCKISVGNNYSMALDKNGMAWGWGTNSIGQIGDNTSVSKLTPVSVAGAVKTFCKISASVEAGRSGRINAAHTLAIDKNGRAWAWGANVWGRLGDGTLTNRLTPVSVSGAVKTFCEIGAGGAFSVSIDKYGRAWGWGYNYYGQIGDNSNASAITPVSVAGAVKTFCKIFAGASHCHAIDKNGQAWSWGYNNFGELGDNSTVSKLTPVSVAGAIKTFCEISSSRQHSVAIDKNGKVWSWGRNAVGALGDGTFVDKLTPVSLAGTNKTFCKIEADWGFSMGIDKYGQVWGWGAGENHRLGNNLNFCVTTPVRICNI